MKNVIQKRHSLNMLRKLRKKLESLRMPKGISQAAEEYFINSIDYDAYITGLASSLIDRSEVRANLENVKKAINRSKHLEDECAARLKELQAYTTMIEKLASEYIKYANQIQ